MKNDPPAPVGPLPPGGDPEFEPLVSVEEEAPSIASILIQRFLSFLLKYWWVPLLTMVLALAVSGTGLWLKPPAYVSTGVMWGTEPSRKGDMGFQNVGKGR
jgi:hypothetical protein